MDIFGLKCNTRPEIRVYEHEYRLCKYSQKNFYEYFRDFSDVFRLRNLNFVENKKVIF